MKSQPCLTDIKTLRERARQHIENGAVTRGYKVNRETIIKLLNEALATEIISVVRYGRHHFMASGLNAQSVAQEFLRHWKEEQIHADQIARRIIQIGGEPDFSLEGLLIRNHTEYVQGVTLIGLIEEDLIAERAGIEGYREMIAYLAGDDTTTRRMLEEILVIEEKHAEDLASLLTELGS